MLANRPARLLRRLQRTPFHLSLWKIGLLSGSRLNRLACPHTLHLRLSSCRGDPYRCEGDNQWTARQSDLKRLIDLTYQGLIDYLFVGSEVETGWGNLLKTLLGNSARLAEDDT